MRSAIYARYSSENQSEKSMDDQIRVLGKNTKASALALKEILGKVELEAITSQCVIENGKIIEMKPFYMVYTNIQTLALLDENKGSNWLQWRRRWDSNPRYGVSVYTLSKRAP